MGAMLACCVGSAACCAGKACCGFLCSACSAAGVPNKNFSKIGYVFLQIIFMGISISVMFSAKTIIDKYDYFNWISCPEDTLPENPDNDALSACLGASNIIRMSFILFLFHALILILLAFRTPMMAAIHDGFWGVKYILVAVGYIASFWINNDFMIFYMDICKFVGTFFLIYQALLMLVVTYKINDTLVGNYNRD